MEKNQICPFQEINIDERHCVWTVRCITRNPLLHHWYMHTFPVYGVYSTVLTIFVRRPFLFF